MGSIQKKPGSKSVESSESSMSGTVIPLDIDERKMREAALQASRLLKSLANDQRLLILCKLVDTEMTVGQIAQHVSLSQSSLSQHLAKLRAEGLVATRKSKQHVFYSLASPEAMAVIETLYGIYCAPADTNR